MCTTTDPATAAEALGMLESAVGMQQRALRFLAAQDAAGLPAPAVADQLRALERADAAGAALRGRLLEVFDSRDGHLAGGQRSTRAWLVHSLRVTRGQAAEHLAVQALARGHRVLHAALAEGWVLTKSEALQLARWTKAIPDQYRGKAEEILVAAARAGVDLRGLAAICAEIRACTAQPDPDDDDDPRLDRGVSLDTTFEGAGVIHGDLTPECAALVRAVLDALSAPQGGGDLRTRPERYHDALAEAMRRLLASDLLPQRAGQPVKALVHVSFADLCALDENSGVQDRWIGEYRARWAAHRAAASVSAGDGGAWLEGTRPGTPRSPPRPPTRWPRWSTRSWPRSCRSSPAPAAPRRSCAATCSASPWPAPPSPWTSGRPTTSRCTCGAWSRCGNTGRPPARYLWCRPFSGRPPVRTGRAPFGASGSPAMFTCRLRLASRRG